MFIGKRVGNYVVTKALGAGGMGEVFIAEHPALGKRVAVKFLSDQFGSHPQIAERFLTEARAVTMISHPGVVEIFDFGELDGRLYYVMELLQGRELEAYIQERGKLTAEEALPLVTQMCSALDAAHALGVVHRDLKPANIFVLEKGGPPTIKLLDFGIAKVFSQTQSVQTMAGQVLGTPAYMSPEQAAGQVDRIGPHSDIYSLGVVLYEMLCGQLPFVHELPFQVMVMHLRDAPPPLARRDKTIPQAVCAVVEKCLKKKPTERPASARELMQAFETAVERSRPAARPSGSLRAATPTRPAGTGPAAAAAHPDRAPRDAPVADPSRQSGLRERPAAARPNTGAWPAERGTGRAGWPAEQGTGRLGKPSQPLQKPTVAERSASARVPDDAAQTVPLRPSSEPLIPIAAPAATSPLGATPSATPSRQPTPVASPAPAPPSPDARAPLPAASQAAAAASIDAPVAESAAPPAARVANAFAATPNDAGAARPFDVAQVSGAVAYPEPRIVDTPATLPRGEASALDGAASTAPATSATEGFEASPSRQGSLAGDGDAPASFDFAQATFGEDEEAALDALMRRIQKKGDFPAFAKNVSEVSRQAVVTSKASAADLAEIVLKDHSVATKLLRHVNSAFYKRFGGTVNTVSKAIVVLGFDQVRTAAMSLTLFGKTRNSSKAPELANSSVASLVCGEIARNVAPNAGLRDGEEAFVAAMFRHLGKHLVLYYVPEVHDRIIARVNAERLPEDGAARQVLGLTYERLGLGVAKRWGFSDRVMAGMGDAPSHITATHNDAERILNLSCFATEVFEVVSTTPDAEQEEAFERLSKRYEKAIPLSPKAIPELVETATRSFKQNYQALLGINPKQSSFLQAVERWAQKSAAEAEPSLARPVPSKKPTPAPVAAPSFDAMAVALGARLELILAAVKQRRDTSEILRLTLETMRLGFPFTRSLYLVPDKERRFLRARAGSGEGTQRLVSELQVPLAKGAWDPFSGAFFKAVPIFVADVSRPAEELEVPGWFVKQVGAHGLYVHPVLQDGTAIGLLYGDSEQPIAALGEKERAFLEKIAVTLAGAVTRK